MPSVSNFDVEERRRDGAGAQKDNKGVIMAVAGGVGVLVIIGVIIAVVMGRGPSCDIANCTEVLLPEGAKDCAGAKCALSKCAEGYKTSPDESACVMNCLIDECRNVSVPTDVTECTDAKVVCAECLPNHTLASDDKGAYCARNCVLENCNKLAVVRGTTDCTTPNAITCEECASDGIKIRKPQTDDKGSYCGVVCEKANCEDATVPRGVDECTTTKCNKCKEGYELKLDTSKFDYGGECQSKCTGGQLGSGCDPNACTSTSSCSACVPGYTIQFSGTCTKGDAPQQMTFYMYRASKNEDYHPENINLATAGGVMWYIHNEVVRAGCVKPDAQKPEFARHYDITRILRYKVTVKNPTEVFNYKKSDGQDYKKQFGHFVQFDSGNCTVEGCAKFWEDYGYNVGCQKAPEVCLDKTIEPPTPCPEDKRMVMYESRFSHSYWYSLPGRCPSKPFTAADKLGECAKAEVGGECPRPVNSDGSGAAQEPGDEALMPTGTKTCTWKIQGDGEVFLDELTGINEKYGTYQKFCDAGNKEYDAETDKGSGIDFWDTKMDASKNEDRTRLLLKKFKEAYPDDPYIADPWCDGF